MITHVQRWAGPAALMAVFLIAAGAEAVTINYRSIGINPGVLYGEGSGPGGATATVLGDRLTVEIASGAIPATVGRGDEIVIDDEELYILSRDSETRLTLQAPAKAGHTGQEFAIRRAYTSIQKWVDDRRGNLVREDRLEVGVLYNDGPYTVKNHWLAACIAGSRTDADHFMWLTAAESARHKGVAGTGVVIDGRDRTRTGILIEDDYTRVDGIELKQFGTWLLPAAVTVRNARGVVLERLIVHDFDGRRHDTYGIKAGVNSDVTVRNTIIYNGDAAGIIARRKSATVQVENCTIYGMRGRGLDEGLGRVSVVNTISMGNGKADYAVRRGPQSYTISSDMSAAGEGSARALSPRDQFVSIEPGREDFHLLDTSAAVDAGKTLVAQQAASVSRATAPADGMIEDPAAIDIDGTDRSQESRWDIGADEVESAPENVWYVDPARNGDGRSWKTAFPTIQQAIDAAAEGQEIWVRAGTYRLMSEMLIDRPVALYGGFTGDERKREKRDPKARLTTLDGQSKSRCLRLEGKDIVVDGFVLSGGYAVDGGAVYAMSGSSFTIHNCSFQGNRSTNRGGALCALGASGVVTASRFSGNDSLRNGGAVYTQFSTSSIVNCVFTGNAAGQAGSPSISGGGAVYSYLDLRADIINCTFYDNRTKFTGNNGHAIHGMYTNVVVTNSVVWGNVASAGAHIHGNPATSVVTTFSNIDQPEFALSNSNGNISAQPMWADPAAGNFHLQSGSPCIDSGVGDVPGLPATDYEGNPRVAGGRVDMGAFEYQ